MSAASFGVVAKVSAACPGSCDYPPAGRDWYHGYLTNSQATGLPGQQGAVWPSTSGLLDVHNGAQFISWVQGSLFDTGNGSVNDRAGAAAYVVTSMLGYKGPDFGDNFMNGVNTARARWTDWVTLVQQYEAAGLVNFDATVVSCHPYTQANMNYVTHDVFFYNTSQLGMTSGCDTEEEVVFTNPVNGNYYRLKKICGNPIGDNYGLPPAGNFTYVPGISANAATNPQAIPGNGTGSTTNSVVYPGQTLKFDLNVTNTGTGTGPAAKNQGVVYALDPSTGMPYYYVDPGCGSSCYNTPANSTTPQSGQVVLYNPGGANNVPALTVGQVYNSPPGSAADSPDAFSFAVPNNAPVGRKYCFYSTVNPGNSSNTTPHTNYGGLCYIVQAPIAASCNGFTLDPSSVDPSTPFSVTVRVRYSSGAEATTALSQPGARLYTTITGPSGTLLPVWSVTPLQYDGSGGVSGTTSFAALNKTGTFTVWYGVENTTNVGKVNCLGDFSVANRPYFQVDGGDVSAGAGMSIGGSECAASGGVNAKQDASIVSWNRGSAGAYGGAGTPFGALALNHLQGFATGKGTGLAPDGVSFANTGGSANQVDDAQQLFGGEFGGTNCTADFFKNASGVQTGNVTIAGRAVANGSRTTIYVDGNVYITGNITFSGSYASAADIPAFSIIVRGNIYIAPGVTQLDGFYIAEPSSGSATNGIIYTCASAPFTAASLNRNLQAICGTALTVNGGFVGRQIWLLRTAGTISSTPAEIFNYVPEAWLSAPYGNGLTPGKTDGYDSITSLPPVL
jgi:hypothetical protein